MIELICEQFGLNIDAFYSFKMGEHHDKVVTLLKEIGFKNVHYEYVTQFRNEVNLRKSFITRFTRKIWRIK